MMLRKAERKQAKIKLAIQGTAGSGKTYSALLLAFGLIGDWSKIAVIDSENGSADLYDNLGEYNVLPLTKPFTPEKYTQALNVCINAGMECVIFDSLSHEWEGEGGVLNIVDSMAGNSFTNWGKVTPRHNAFVQAMLHAPIHVIGTIRSKQDYVLVEKNGKQVPQKVGMKGVAREGMDYEFTLAFELDIKHVATATKDRTSMFIDQPEFTITPETGKQIAEWCNKGIDPREARKAEEEALAAKVDEGKLSIASCTTPDQVNLAFKALSPEVKEILKDFAIGEGRKLKERNSAVQA